MSVFKKFLTEKSGAGIVEYLILLSLLGSVVAVTTPSIREQVGLIYEEQVRLTNNLNGMIDTKSSERFDLISTNPIVRAPAGIIVNPEVYTLTPNPVPVSTNPNQQVITEQIKNITGTFDPEYYYNKNGFSGLIQLVPGARTSQVIEQRTKVLTKNVSKIITKPTAEEFDSILSLSETDAEGYTGDITPNGPIQQVLVGDNGSTETISKNSGPIIYSQESYQTDPATINSLFPNSYFYVEMSPDTLDEEGKTTGYEGTVYKTGTPTSTYIGQIIAPDSKNALQNRDFTNEVDISTSQQSKNYRVVAPTTGINAPTNPNSYSSTYYYNDGNKEGLLNYVSKGSTKIDTRVDTINLNINPTFSYSPPTTYNYNVNGYTGTLNSTNAATVQSGYYDPAASKYVSGQSSSNYNDGTYSGTLSSYVSGQSWVSADSFYATDSRSQSGYCATDPNCGPSNIPGSVSYNSGGYSGTLSQTSYSYSQSQTAVPFSYSRYATYGGTVTKPGYWVNNYAYQGTVYKPAYDSRVWTRNYVGTASKVIDTYEYHADYTGIIFAIQPRDNNIAPASIVYTDPQAYTGTLYKNNASLVSTLKSMRTTTTPKTVTNHKVYTPGDFASSSNTQTYPATYTYSDAGLFNGTLNYASKSSEFAYSQQENHKSQTFKQTSSSSPIASTYNYNSGGFWGTLNAINTTYVDSGSYTPSDTIYVTNQGSSWYNSSGYSGTLSQYLESSTWTGSSTIFVDNQPSSSYNSGGYSGTLSQYLYSGSYTASDSRWEYTTKQGDNWQHYGCTSNKWVVTNSGETNIQGTTYTYNSGGYSGTYSVTSVDYKTSTAGTYRSSGSYCATNGATGYYKEYNTVYMSAYVTKPASDTRIYKYEGNVVRPGYYTDVYRYQGNVTKAAVDTRVYARDFDGIVSQTINYYKHFANYSGSTSRTNYLATYNYNANYEGVISKNISRNNYRYDQTYSGTLSKDVISFTYEYQREFTGTLFKEVNEDIIEYTQTYEGTVEEIQ
jgi:hypothetical protein